MYTHSRSQVTATAGKRPAVRGGEKRTRAPVPHLSPCATVAQAHYTHKLLRDTNYKLYEHTQRLTLYKLWLSQSGSFCNCRY